VPLNPSWLVYDGSVTRWGDGSAQAPVLLPALQEVSAGLIQFNVGTLANGQLAKTAGVTTTIANNLAGGTAGEVVYQTGVNQTGFTAVGSSAQLLQSNGTGAPTWIGANNLSVTATGTTTARTLANRFTDTVNVKDFGAVGNAGISGTGVGVVDDGPAFQAANDYLASLGGGVINYNEGRYYIGTSITLSRNVCIQGPTGRSDGGNPFGISTAYFQSLQTVSALIINPSATITTNSSSGIIAVYAFRKGMALDGTDLATNFSGTAFTASSADATFAINSSIIGFQYGIYHTNSSRAWFEDLLIDCNNGIVDNGAGDINRYTNVHCYGVTQANATGHETFSDRSGNAFYFGTNITGGPIINGCFAYSYQSGFYLDVAGSYTINDSWVDGTIDNTGYPLVPNRTGIFFNNTITNAEPQINNVKISAQGVGIALEAGNYGVIQLSNIVMWFNVIGIDVFSKNLNATNLAIRGYWNTGILFNSKNASDTAKIVNLLMYDRQNPSTTLDINGGGGSPSLLNASYIDGILNIQNTFCDTLTPSSGVITFPNGKTFAYINGTGQITGILPAWDGLTVNLEFNNAGSTFSSSAFRISGGSFTALAGSSITLRYNISTTKWDEVCRAL
jgi:hypothetical protein